MDLKVRLNRYESMAYKKSVLKTIKQYIDNLSDFKLFLAGIVFGFIVAISSLIFHKYFVDKKSYKHSYCKSIKKDIEFLTVLFVNSHQHNPNSFEILKDLEEKRELYKSFCK